MSKNFRQYFRSEIIPRSYSGKAHCIISFSAIISCIIFFALKVKEIPFTHIVSIIFCELILGNLFVYVFHRYPLHKKIIPFQKFFQIHSSWHHQFFTEKDVTYKDTRDFFIVFFPLWSSLLTSFIFTPTFYFLLTNWLPQSYAALWSLMIPSYFLLYETFHYICHVDDHSILMKVSYFRFIREHHRWHHKKSLMTQTNFNIVFPLFDFIFGTLHNPRNNISLNKK